MIISNNILKTNENQIKDKKIKAFCELTTAVDRMIAGEYVDTEFEGKEISSEYLEYMHKNKTGALIKASVKIGAILAGANENDLKKLELYAENIGLAFQIKDDILSEIGDEKTLGKPIGNDREHKKVTFITKYGLEESEKILDDIISKGLKELESYADKAKFLKELSKYIKERKK